MDQSDDGSDLFADLNPLSSNTRQPSYLSKAPVSVSLVSLFSMDPPPPQLGLLPTMQNDNFNSTLIQMESSSANLMLQKPPLSSNKPPAHTTLMASNPGTNKFMPTFKLPRIESLTQIAIPPSQISSRSKRKSPTEKSTKSLTVTSPTYQAKPLKAQIEIFDSVRAKLRDSLASALTLASCEKPNGTEVLTTKAVKEEGAPLVDLGLGDDLLRGNGLSWVADVGPEGKSTEMCGGAASKRAKVDFEESEDKNRVLAASIEAELFRLFGGVNKKYKEKGRSLLFNLKDPSNPELRTRVNTGDITPQRLCSMSAEELASKELTEWRMAKAEEFAHMVVLQEDVDLRRVVKKTHKGEFQVEVEDDSTSVEVAVGSNSLPPILSKSKVDAKPVNGGSEKANEDDVEDIQELMVDGREAESLPPIVSLDEFMEALDSEPPFENLPAGAGDDGSQLVSLPDEKVNSTIAGDSLITSNSSKTDNSESKKVNDGGRESVLGGVDLSSKTVSDGHIWEGVVQLTVSSAATLQAFFMSGEKASTKDWPAVVEVKGRVRVEAFEKFLRDLPLSKSRAMMVLHLLWKEGSPEGGRKAISEASESYAADGRLGYVEPCPGVELYVCPPGSTTSQLLGGQTVSPLADALRSKAPADALVGVVVWRRALLESPRPQKPSSKKFPISRKHKTPPPQSSSEEAVVDDVPPGFGPPREEDDLPEFDFQRASSSGPNNSAYQMRELIHKYGSQGGVGARPSWVDDDDIPEWKPHQLAPRPPLPPLPPQFLQHAAAPPGAWPAHNGGHGFVAGDRRGVMDWRYGDVHRNRGL